MIIVGATIRMAVLARSREIELLRLVGATDASYACLPARGRAQGAARRRPRPALTWVAHTLVSRYVVATAFFPTSVVLLGVLAGATLGLLGSAVSVGRHTCGSWGRSGASGGGEMAVWVTSTAPAPTRARRVRVRGPLCALLLACVGGAGATGAGAQPGRGAVPPPAVAAREQELARTKAERQLLETQLRSLRATAGDIREEARLYDRQADATARLVTTLDRQLAEIGEDAFAATQRLAQAEQRLAGEQVGLRRRLVDIYKRGPLYEAEAMLSARSFGDLVIALPVPARGGGARSGAGEPRARAARLGGGCAHAHLAPAGGSRAQPDREAEEARRLRTLEAERGRALADAQRRARAVEERLARVARDERRLSSLIAAAEDARRRTASRDAARAARALRAAPAGRLRPGSTTPPRRCRPRCGGTAPRRPHSDGSRGRWRGR
jgi:hypothetical protein